MRSFVVSLAILLVGCVAEPLETASQDSLQTLPTWVCPSGETAPLGDVCAGTLDATPDQLSEPFIAIHPLDPLVMVVGANSMRSTGTATLVGTQAAVTPLGVDFFVTRDGGATWSRPTPPTPGVGIGVTVQAGLLVDASQAIHRDGVLHATFLVQGIAPAKPPELQGVEFHQGFPFNEVAYASSPDLGETWSQAVILSQGDGRADRNWLGVSPEGLVVATWQRFSVGSSSVAWLQGDQWSQVDLNDCTQVSAPVFSGLAIRVLCTHYGMGPQDVSLREVDPTTGNVVQIASVGLVCTFATLVGQGANWGAVCEQDTRITLVASQDGGVTWGPRLDLEEAWASGSELKAAALDEAGRLHVLAGTDTTGVHSIGDLNGTLLAQASWPMAGAPQTSLAPDDYWGLDVSQSLGAVVATSASHLLLLRVELNE